MNEREKAEEMLQILIRFIEDNQHLFTDKTLNLVLEIKKEMFEQGVNFNVR